VALIQLLEKARVSTNLPYLVHSCEGISWEHFSATVKEAFLPSKAGTDLNCNRESLRIEGGNRISSRNGHV